MCNAKLNLKCRNVIFILANFRWCHSSKPFRNRNKKKQLGMSREINMSLLCIPLAECVERHSMIPDGHKNAIKSNFCCRCTPKAFEWKRNLTCDKTTVIFVQSNYYSQFGKRSSADMSRLNLSKKE